jgi:hypothetical protein
MSETLREIFSRDKRFDERILSAAEEGNLVFFIGAGVSRLMGLPGWEDFSAILIKKAFSDYTLQKQILREITSSKERITIAYKEMEKNNQKKEFYDCFGAAMEPQEGCSPKKNIYEILSRFDALFLTTNADNLFEEVLGSASCHEDWNISKNPNISLDRAKHLFYLHGHYKKDINIEENNLVFTADKYVERYNDKGFQEFLRKVLSDNQKVVIFIGYGMNEFELIDYIVTKAGYNDNQDKRIYIMMGFCSNEDAIYQAKKAYFDSLNINVIPYDMDINGYSALIDVLEAYYECYKKTVIPPNREEIEAFVKDCSKDNISFIINYLKDAELAKSYEKKISDEILKNDYSAWMEALSKKGFFTVDTLEKRISNRAWTMLNVLLKWVKDGSERAQEAAINFLNSISSKHITELTKTRNFILDDIVGLIMSLDRKNIKMKYIELLGNANLHPNAFLLVVLRNEYIDKLVTWQKVHLIAFMNKVFGDVDFEKRHDMDSYAIKEIVNRFLKAIPEKHNANNMLLNYFTSILLKNAESKNYNTFMHVNNLDNLEKTHDEYYLYTFNAIKAFFERVGGKDKQKYLSELIMQDKISSKKLGLHLARKYELVIDIDLSKVDLYDTYEYYCEFYIYLKYLNEVGELNEYTANDICEKVLSADWGLYKNGIQREERLDRYIESKRLAILQYLPGEKSKRQVSMIRDKGIEPYDPVEVANKCDYVRSMKWEPENSLPKEKLKGVAVEYWVNELEPLLSLDNLWEVRATGEQYVKFLLERSKEEILKGIESLKVLPIRKIEHVLAAIYSKYDSFYFIKESILDFCIWILDSAKKDNENIDLIKITFQIIRKIIEIDSGYDLAKKTLSSINSWLSFSINKERAFDANDHVLENLINFGDFDKYLVWLNCLICIKSETKQVMSNEDILLIFDLLKNDKDNTLRYTLCYYYQNIRFLTEGKSREIFDKITIDKNGFDLIALQLCVLNTKQILKEFVEKVVCEYLNKTQKLPRAASNNMVAQHFYSFILSAWSYDEIGQEEFIKAFKDDGFIEYYFHNLTFLSSKENFDLEKHIKLGWSYLKENNLTNLCEKYSSYVLHTMDDVNEPTVGLLDLYLEVAKISKDFSAYSIRLEDVAKFFDVNIDKAHELTKFVVIKRMFWDDENLRKIFEKYRTNKKSIRKGKEIVKLLQANGTISFDQMDYWAKFLDEQI